MAFGPTVQNSVPFVGVFFRLDGYPGRKRFVLARYPFDWKHFLVPTATNQIRLQPQEDIILDDGATPIRGVSQSNRSEMTYYQATDRPSPTRVNRNPGDRWRDWLFAHEETIQQKRRDLGGRGKHEFPASHKWGMLPACYPWFVPSWRLTLLSQSKK